MAAVNTASQKKKIQNFLRFFAVEFQLVQALCTVSELEDLTVHFEILFARLVQSFVELLVEVNKFLNQVPVIQPKKPFISTRVGGLDHVVSIQVQMKPDVEAVN